MLDVRWNWPRLVVELPADYGFGVEDALERLHSDERWTVGSDNMWWRIRGSSRWCGRDRERVAGWGLWGLVIGWKGKE